MLEWGMPDQVDLGSAQLGLGSFLPTKLVDSHA